MRVADFLEHHQGELVDPAVAAYVHGLLDCSALEVMKVRCHPFKLGRMCDEELAIYTLLVRGRFQHLSRATRMLGSKFIRIP